MLCEVCKKQYAITTRQVDKGYGTESIAVCNDCLKTLDNPVSKLDFIDAFWGNNRKLTKCGVCGTTIESILKSGYVGCSTCYQIFKNEIADMVYSIQSKNLHVGKVPLSITEKRDRETDVSGMMAMAIESDDFNLAQIVRNHFPGRRGGLS